MRLNAVLFVLNLSVSLGPLTSGTPSVEKEYSNVEGGEFITFTFLMQWHIPNYFLLIGGSLGGTNDSRILGGWHPGDSTKYCMRR